MTTPSTVTGRRSPSAGDTPTDPEETTVGTPAYTRRARQRAFGQQSAEQQAPPDTPTPESPAPDGTAGVAEAQRRYGHHPLPDLDDNRDDGRFGSAAVRRELRRRFGPRTTNHATGGDAA